jgi:hypothetical protein
MKKNKGTAFEKSKAVFVLLQIKNLKEFNLNNSLICGIHIFLNLFVEILLMQ